jgi:hypothetical protein
LIGSLRYEVDLRDLRRPSAILVVGGLVLAHLPSGVGLPCPLRTLTGVPCPFCGLTTSIRGALGGRPGQAWSAAPLGLVVLALALALSTDALVAWMRRAPRRLDRVVGLPVPLLLGLLGAEWMFELHRFRVLV